MRNCKVLLEKLWSRQALMATSEVPGPWAPVLPQSSGSKASAWGQLWSTAPEFRAVRWEKEAVRQSTARSLTGPLVPKWPGALQKGKHLEVRFVIKAMAGFSAPFRLHKAEEKPQHRSYPHTKQCPTPGWAPPCGRAVLGFPLLSAYIRQ